MEIRAAVESDLDAAARVQARTMVHSDYYDESTDQQREYERLHPRVAGYCAGTYHPGHALAKRALFVADEEGRVVGFIAGHLSTRMGCEGELQWMFVEPALQRRGIGGALLEPLARWFVQQDARRVIIDAPPANPCRAFYLKHGARPLDGYWLYWPDVETVLPIG